MFAGSWSCALELCKDNVLDVMWLNHEIGRCHLELANYEEAKKCGQISVEAAIKEDDSMWCVNGWVLIAQSCGKLRQCMGPYSAKLW